jgi:PhnB protein
VDAIVDQFKAPSATQRTLEVTVKIEVMLNLNGTAKDAAEFYAHVFRSKVSGLMTFKDAPPSPDFPMDPKDADRVMYAGVEAGEMVLMLMDTTSGAPYVEGNNVSLTISDASKVRIDRIFSELAEGGQVMMPQMKTFFSPWYGMLKDKFGIIWQIMQFEAPKAEPTK